MEIKILTDCVTHDVEEVNALLVEENLLAPQCTWD